MPHFNVNCRSSEPAGWAAPPRASGQACWGGVELKRGAPPRPSPCTGEQAVVPVLLPDLLMPPGTSCRLAADPHPELRIPFHPNPPATARIGPSLSLPLNTLR